MVSASTSEVGNRNQQNLSIQLMESVGIGQTTKQKNMLGKPKHT